MRESGIGAVKRPVDEVDDLFGRLRSYSKDPKWTSEEDEELDRKKADMDMCDTDQQLLEWAMREVFDESKRYEEEARAALSNPTSPSNKKIIHLQPPSYPHLIAELMRKFRDKYSDPHLTLSVFEHARHLSTVSLDSIRFGKVVPLLPKRLGRNVAVLPSASKR
ncbi:hypothetical protein K474DRAFT_1709608 [Panus rudis PR-1116 ss-1]|nr:hypothetical protein K474DRAFT_1709608 [Panus rudis PR-1116 ss-1]